jgi:hypothetical protein
MKALEKDRSRRYETASSLAADIDRHLGNEPVIARPPSSFYRFNKLLRRNKLAFAAVSAVGIALVLGICVTTWALVRERAARREAESARNVARSESARNEQIANFLLTTVSPDTWSGQDAPLVRSILLDFFSTRLATKLTNQPRAQGDLWLSVANSCAAIGDYGRAITNLQNSANAYRLTFGADHGKVALALSRLSRIQSKNGDVATSRTNAKEAIRVARKFDDNETLATCLLEAAKSFSDSGVPTPEAIPWLREAMHLRRHVVPHLLALSDSTRLLVKALEGLAADGHSGEAMAILDEELRTSPKDADLRRLRQKLAP